jgi:hypothetical protein
MKKSLVFLCILIPSVFSFEEPAVLFTQLNPAGIQKQETSVYPAAFAFLFVIGFAFAIIIIQFKKRKAAERSLQEANRIKEEYIRYFFNVNAEYLCKIEAFKRAVEMKLLTKRPDDIKSILTEINVRGEREKLYSSFDMFFLKLFPCFVMAFNSFFRDEDKIILKEGQLLNTELRIFALMRMGISDAEKIARILNYSVSTVYNYKARLKNRSVVPNDEFEKKIMAIPPS